MVCVRVKVAGLRRVLSPMDLPPLPADCSAHTCHLFYRPLREGSGKGPPAPWTLETFDDSDSTPQQRGGPARDALAELARGGGRWLAFVTCSGLGWAPELCGPIFGEYVVCSGEVKPLAAVDFRWPIQTWERGHDSALSLLHLPGIPQENLLEAMIAWLRLAVKRLSSVPLDTVKRIEWWEKCLIRALAGETRSPMLAAIDQASLAWLGRIAEEVCNDPRGEAAPGREAWVAAWNRDSVAEVRRVVGDAWFIARATPKADQ